MFGSRGIGWHNHSNACALGNEIGVRFSFGPGRLQCPSDWCGHLPYSQQRKLFIFPSPDHRRLSTTRLNLQCHRASSSSWQCVSTVAAAPPSPGEVWGAHLRPLLFLLRRHRHEGRDSAAPLPPRLSCAGGEHHGGRGRECSPAAHALPTAVWTKGAPQCYAFATRAQLWLLMFAHVLGVLLLDEALVEALIVVVKHQHVHFCGFLSSLYARCLWKCLRTMVVWGEGKKRDVVWW